MIKKLVTFPTEGLQASIVLSRFNGSYHTGIIHQHRDNNSLHILHLAWHHDLQNDDFSQLSSDSWDKTDYYVIPVNFPAILQTQLAAICRRIFDRSKTGKFPYGFLYDGTTFYSPEEELILGERCCGLTCATFVISVFTHIGINLIDVLSWTRRVTSDEEWHNKIIKLLKERGVDEEHINRLKLEVGCGRFRPNEVAGSLRFKVKPATMDKIISAGELIDSLITLSQTP